MGKKSNQVQETSQQRELADYARKQYDDYKKRWLPVQENLSKQIMEAGEANSSVRMRAQGRAANDTTAKFDQAETALEKTMASTVGLGSSRAKLGLTGLGDDKAKSLGLGVTLADQQVDDAYTEGLSALAAAGRGERAAVGDALARQASTSAQQAEADAEAALALRAGNAQMGGQVLGLGLQQGMSSFGKPKSAFTGTNDFAGTTGGNSLDRFFRAGSGGD